MECILLKHVVSSAEEAETGALFHNCKTALGIKQILQALGHAQKKVHV